jgi:hypothetical protein
MRWLLALLVYCVVACRPQGAVAPDGTPLHCGTSSDEGVVTCVGGGRAYKCTTDWVGCQAQTCGEW